MVERLNGIQEVRGSTPLVSTTHEKTNIKFVFFFCVRWRQGERLPLLQSKRGAQTVIHTFNFCLDACYVHHATPTAVNTTYPREKNP